MRDGLEILLEKIPRNGMSKKCQEFLPFIAKYYFDGKQLEDIKSKLSKKHREYAKEIYKRIENTITISSLKKITPVMGLHPEDVKYGVAFIDTILKYCTILSPKKEKLEKKLIDAINMGDRNFRIFLKRRYKEGGSNKDDINMITKIKNQNFYLFIAKNILNGNY